MVDQKTVTRFWNNVKTGNKTDCWLWQGRVSKGRPLFNLAESRTINPARFAYELKYGTIPKGRQVTMSCQNNFCVNPDHVKDPNDLRSHFWSMVDISDKDSCWMWKGKCSSKMPSWDSKNSGLSRYASRAAYEITFGAIPEDKRIKHTCGELKCCNPRHLQLSDDLDVRFWSKVDKTPGLGIGDCWEWRSTVDYHGYGTFKYSAEVGNVLAHRLSYALAMSIPFEDLPSNTLILHRCDNPLCLRDSHLWEGTQKDNIQDAIAKGRFKFNYWGRTK